MFETEELYEFLDLQLQSDLNEERSKFHLFETRFNLTGLMMCSLMFFVVRHYEVVYLIHEKHAEEVESVNEKVQGEQKSFLLFVSPIFIGSF